MLKHRLKILLGVIVACTLTYVKGVAQERYTADKVVAVVGNSMVLYSDVEKLSKRFLQQQKEAGYTPDQDARSQALEQLILSKVLYNQALIDSIKINEVMIEQRISETLEEETQLHGSLAALERYYGNPVFEIKKELRNQAMEENYAYEMENTVRNKVVVTPGEVEKFFKRLPKDSVPLIPEQYVYAQIIRFPSSREEAKMRAQTKLLELRERILNGEKFETLARIYSEDGSASRGGDLGLITKDMVVERFANAMTQLKPGQVSGVVETEYGFHLIQMIEQVGPQYHVRHIVVRPQYFQRDLEAPYNFLDSVRNEIIAGNLTFEEAVAEYSEDRYSQKNGGIASNMEQLEAYYRGMVDPADASTKFYKEQLNREDLEALSELKPGEISKPYASQNMTSDLLCKMVMLKEIIPVHRANLSEDYKQIERLALAQKQEVEMNKWIQEKIRGMYIRIDKDFRDCKFMQPALNQINK